LGVIVASILELRADKREKISQMEHKFPKAPVWARIKASKLYCLREEKVVIRN